MKCLNCGKEAFENGLLKKDGSSTFAPGEAYKVEYQNNEKFIRCPYCRAKNIFADNKSENGVNQMYFQRFEMD
jgi:DNA-directed RNA polymerase subunit RPC12/RpoP